MKTGRSERICGIYRITNAVTGKSYIGGSVDIYARWRLHIHELRHRKHRNRKLQNSFIKHGESAFGFSIIEKCQESVLTDREQHWLDTEKPYVDGYNIAMGAARVMIGFRHSPESIAKMSAAQKGKRLGVKRGPMSEDQKRKISESLRGVRHTEEAKKKIGDASRARGIFSETHIQNMRKAQKGHPVSHEQRMAISKTLTGRKPSPESLLKRSLSMKAIIARAREKNGGVVPWLIKSMETRALNKNKA